VAFSTDVSPHDVLYQVLYGDLFLKQFYFLDVADTEKKSAFINVKPMRILLINQFYKPDVAATGQLLADLAEGLAKKGHRVHMLCNRHAYNGNGMVFPSREIINGVYVHRVGATGFGRTKKFGRIADYLSFYIFAFWKALLLPKMDVCVCLTTPPFIALVGLMLRKLKGTKLVFWTMDLYPEVAVAYGVIKPGQFLHRFFSRLSRKLYNEATCIISLGEVMTQRLVGAGADPQKIETVHNWVPGEVVHQAGRK